jgi:hypothetical protein
VWTVCRREHGLNWSEFEALTLAEFEALEERRSIAIRHARFNAALVVSTLFNVNRGEDTPSMSPFDLIAGFEEDEEERERATLRRSVRQAVALAFMEMKGATPAQLQAEKMAMIARMKASGIEDPEEIIREVYPNL